MEKIDAQEFKDLFYKAYRGIEMPKEIEDDIKIKTFTSILMLFADMSNTIDMGYEEIFPADDPYALTIGWACADTQEVWEISLSNLKKNSIPSDILNSPKYNIVPWIKENKSLIERYIDLKVFW